MTHEGTDAAAAIAEGHTSLGIEFGSTNIKACLIGPDHQVLATGNHGWENQFVDRLWTYSEEAIWTGLQDAVASLMADVKKRHGVSLTRIGALGFSAMMHGYLPLTRAANCSCRSAPGATPIPNAPPPN